MRSVERFPTLRQSRLAAFDSCALRANFEEEFRRHWSGHPQARGQMLHRVYARALKTMHERGERRIPTDAMLELLFDELRMTDGELVNLPMEQVKDMRWEAVKWATDNEFDIENLVDVEHRLSGPISYPGADGLPVQRVLTGQLDAMFVSGAEDDEAIVLDYKSTWDLPGPSEVGFEGYFQQKFYAWLVLGNYPAIQRVTLRELYTRYSQFREASVYRSDYEYLQAELAALAERFDRAFDTGEFPASPGRHCQMCAMPGSCPIFPDVRVEGMITDEVTARRVAGEAFTAKAALKQREAALKAWASAHGPVTINSTAGRERVWGFKSRKRVSRPTREQLEREMGLHGSRVDLSKLYPEQLQTRFEPHQPVDIPREDSDDALYAALRESVDRQNAALAARGGSESDEDRAA